MLKRDWATPMMLLLLAGTVGCGDSSNDDVDASERDANFAVDSGSGTGTDAGSGTGTDAGSDSGTASPGMATVTSEEGGSADVDLEGDDEASVEVPPGAVTVATNIEVAAADPMELPTLAGAGAAPAAEPVAFTPHGTTFAMPVTIAFTIDGGVPAGAVIVRLDDENDTEWELVASTISGNVISAQVTGFSIYTVATGSVCHQADPDSDGDGICDSADPCAAPSDDTDGNGVCDDTEARIAGTVTDVGNGGAVLAGVTVSLYDDLQNLEGTTTTDATGMYFFGGLVADTYTASVADVANCWYGSGESPVALGEIATIDISAGCF